MNNAERLERLSQRYGSSPADGGKKMPAMHRGRPNMHKKGKPKDASKTMKRILQYISKDKYKLAMAFLFVILSRLIYAQTYNK